MCKQLMCMCIPDCFPVVYVPDAYSALAVINRFGCFNARYTMWDDQLEASIRIQEGIFEVCLDVTSVPVSIETSAVDMYLFWMIALDKYKYALSDEESDQIAKSFEVADGRISFNGEDIKPYCDFAINEYLGNIFIKGYKHGIDYVQFVALSAAVNGRQLLC